MTTFPHNKVNYSQKTSNCGRSFTLIVLKIRQRADTVEVTRICGSTPFLHLPFSPIDRPYCAQQLGVILAPVPLKLDIEHYLYNVKLNPRPQSGPSPSHLFGATFPGSAAPPYHLSLKSSLAFPLTNFILPHPKSSYALPTF